MRHDEDTVQRTGLAQAIANLGQKGVKESLLDRPARLRDGDTQRQRRPGLAAVHLLHEARQIGRRVARAREGLSHDFLAAYVNPASEIRGGGDGGEAVAFDGKAKDGNSWRGVGHFRQWRCW